MDLNKLKEFLNGQQEPLYRYNQILKNYFSGKINFFDDMTDISLSLRQKLKENVPLFSVTESKIFQDNSSQKSLLELEDGKKIETVLMDYNDWITVCVSSQVGCPLACRFCATGKMGFVRNLTAEEIVDQILYWNRKIYPKYVGRIVFMGMGEPFLNWDNLLEAIKIMNSKDGLNIGSRKISISTAGVVEKIYDFAALDNQINLAISLHSVNQKNREYIMPIGKKYSLDELKKACDVYTQKTNRQLFFEYALMDKINDSHEDALSLIKFLKSNHLFYLNLIPLNFVSGGLAPSTKTNQENFIRELDKHCINYSIRRSFGQSFDAACGQLATKD